jgi:hypothetical protein
MTTLARAHPDGPLKFNLDLQGVSRLYKDYEQVRLLTASNHGKTHEIK